MAVDRKQENAVNLKQFAEEQAAAQKENEARDANIAAAQTNPVPTEDVVGSSVEPADQIVAVELNSDYTIAGVAPDSITVSVANFEDLTLTPGTPYDVPSTQAALLIATGAVVAA